MTPVTFWGESVLPRADGSLVSFPPPIFPVHFLHVYVIQCVGPDSSQYQAYVLGVKTYSMSKVKLDEAYLLPHLLYDES